MYKLICQKQAHFLSAQMDMLDCFLQIFRVLGMYNFEAKASELIFPLENSCRHQIGSKTFSEGRWTKNFCGMSRGNSAKQKRCAMKTPFVQKTCQCSTADRDLPIKRPPLSTLVDRLSKISITVWKWEEIWLPSLKIKCSGLIFEMQ